MNTIAAVIFDWGGVLIDNPSHGLERYCARHLGLSRAAYRRAFRAFERAFQTGMVSESALWSAICDKLRGRMPATPSLWYEAFASVYSPKRNVFRIVESLRSAGYRIGLLSNTELPAMRYFMEQNYRVFDATGFSCAIGAAKPDPTVYRWIAARLETDPSECIFIDDKKPFVDAAVGVGMHGIVFRTVTQLIADLRRHNVHAIA